MTEPPSVPDEAKAAFLAQMQALTRAYALALPDKIEALAAAIPQDPSAAFGDALSADMLAHRLAGSAGSYGFAALGRLARQVELALKGLTSAPDRPAALAAIESALRQARIEAQAAAASARTSNSR